MKNTCSCLYLVVKWKKFEYKRRGGDKLKRFFGGIFIEKEKLQKEGISHPIKLEYYKNINEEDNDKNKYGITIVKTEYILEKTKVETKDLESITNDENKINKILNLFKNNEVTTIHSEEIMTDLIKSGI